MFDLSCAVRLHLGWPVCLALSDGSWLGIGIGKIEWELALVEGSIIFERWFGAALVLGMRTGRLQRVHRVLDESRQKEGQWKISKARHVRRGACSPCPLRCGMSDDGRS